MQSFRRRDLLTRWALVVPVLLTLGLALLNNVSQGEINQSFEWVRHTLEVEVTLRGLLDASRNAEAAQRGILLGRTLDDVGPQSPYRLALDSIDPALRQFSAMTADNPVQAVRARQLADVVKRYTGALEASITLAAVGRRDSALAIVRNDSALGASLQAMVEAGLAEERRLLIGRGEELRTLLSRRQKLGVSVVVLNVILLAGFLYLLRRFQKQQNMVTVCAWSRVIKHDGEWITFEQYLGKQFNVDVSHGMSPEAAERLLAPTEEAAG